MSSADSCLSCAPPAAAAAAVLRQCAAFVRTLPDGCYATPCDALMGSTIGQHLRHSVDHVSAILAGMDAGVIDYDHRDRGVPIETDADLAVRTLEDLSARLAGVDSAAAATPVKVRVMLTSDGTTTDLETTVGRELAFAAHHETHHHAMMSAIAGLQGHEAPAGFGVAPSTLSFESAGA